MRRWRHIGVSLGCVALVASLPTMTAKASTGGVQSVVSMGSAIGTGYIAAPFLAGHDFNVLMVVPTVSVGTPAAGGVDVSRAWAGLEIEAGGYPGASVFCNTLSNPAVATGDAAGASLSFVATCPDGSPYQSYRVTWNRISGAFAPTALGQAASVEWDQGTSVASLVASTGAWFVGRITVCGLAATTSRCVSTPDPSVGWVPGEAWGSAGVTLTNVAVETASGA